MGKDRISPTPDQGVNVITLHKAGHCYLFAYTDQTRAEAMRWAGRHAVNPELNFSWVDASLVTKAGRDIAQKGVL